MLEMALIQQCSPYVDPVVAQAIVKTESSFRPFAIGVNKGARLNQPQDYSQAVVSAKKLIGSGGNIDLGLAQINSKNLNWLKLSVEKAFDPCSNLKAMQTVYNDCYSRAGNSGLGTRMQRAFSCYNTGNMKRGFRNGYVNKVTKNYNELKPIVARAINTPTRQSITQPTQPVKFDQLRATTQPAKLPNNGADLANYATQLQANAEGFKSNQSDLSVRNNQPHTIQAGDVSVRNSPLADIGQEPIKGWDIFQDFN